MATEDKGRPLPKFGEWDVNDPASAEGFTIIFAKARDDKKTNGSTRVRRDKNASAQTGAQKKWFCCC